MSVLWTFSRGLFPGPAAALCLKAQPRHVVLSAWDSFTCSHAAAGGGLWMWLHLDPPSASFPSAPCFILARFSILCIFFYPESWDVHKSNLPKTSKLAKVKWVTLDKSYPFPLSEFPTLSRHRLFPHIAALGQGMLSTPQPASKKCLNFFEL